MLDFELSIVANATIESASVMRWIIASGLRITMTMDASKMQTTTLIMSRNLSELKLDDRVVSELLVSLSE